MKFLIIQTAFIGDVVLATPIIEKLKAKFPNSTIDFVLRKGNEALLDGHPHLNRVLVFDKSRKSQSMRELIRQLRKEKYDYAINLHRFFTSGWMTIRSGAKTKIGFDKNPLALFYNKKVKHEISETSGLHEVHRNLKLIEELTDGEFDKPKLYPTAAHEKFVPQNKDYVCIAPASVWFTKQWPADKWTELVRKVPEKFYVYLIGSPDDVNLCEEIQSNSNRDNVTVLAGKTSMMESVALIKHSKMTFTNDSAPMHFASATNAPVTAIFCSTIPEFGFGPLSDHSVVMQTNENLACRPCGLHGKAACPEGHFKCADIDIDRIVAPLVW